MCILSFSFLASSLMRATEDTKGVSFLRLGALALAAVGISWFMDTELWLRLLLVAAPLSLVTVGALFSKTKMDFMTYLCAAVIVLRIVDSLHFHYLGSATTIRHARTMAYTCATDQDFALEEAKKEEGSGCSKALLTLDTSRIRIALASVGGLNGWIWLLTGLDFSAGFHTLAQSHVGYLWAAGTCFSVVVLVSSFALALYARITGNGSGAPVCAPEHNKMLYLPPPPKVEHVSSIFGTDHSLPIAFGKKKTE